MNDEQIEELEALSAIFGDAYERVGETTEGWAQVRVTVDSTMGDNETQSTGRAHNNGETHIAFELTCLLCVDSASIGDIGIATRLSERKQCAATNERATGARTDSEAIGTVGTRIACICT